MKTLEDLDNLIKKNPEMKKMIEEDDKWQEDRIQYYLSQGLSEKLANEKMWADYWKNAYDDYGVKVSIGAVMVEEGADENE